MGPSSGSMEESGMERRHFLKTAAAGLAAWRNISFGQTAAQEPAGHSLVVLVKTRDRKKGVKAALEILNFTPPKNRPVLIKPNFNSSDPSPGSTHNDVLVQLVEEMRARGATAITVGERSGPPDSHQVMEDKGIFDLARDLNFGLINYEELAESDWVGMSPEGSYWEGGFAVARPVLQADYIAAACCLKTHQYGAIYSMALKLAVGLTPKRLMRQLHTSPHMRRMIAELNLAYRPQLILMDGVDVFVDGGPMTGKRARADVILAGTCRVAMDAVGLAILKELGSNEAIMSRKIFEQEQIQRAVELGLGVARPDLIRLVGPDSASRMYAGKIKTILARG
jgi:uncharacterized protein (DUF362 family)